MKIPKNTKLLITGAPRSGTYFTARLLFNLGLNIRHEYLDTHGTVSSIHLLNTSGFTKVVHQIREPLKSISSLHKIDWLAQELWIDQKRDENFTGHFKNNLVSKKSIDSDTIESNWLYFLDKIKDRNLTRKCMKAYICWNELASEKSDYTYKLEDILTSSDYFNSWLMSLGLTPEEGDYQKSLKFTKEVDVSNSILSKHTGSLQIGGVRTSPDLSWEILESLDSGLSQKIKNLTSGFYS
tara:strand:+ start:2031 stop:2747 length:717 start_codon:yes stop_codon:yes gene_type:complete